MALLFSLRNFLEECENIWRMNQELSATLVSAYGVRHRIDLLKLSVFSSLVMDFKKSLEIPDSLSHLLDIDIILPDFSEDVVNILCDTVEGLNTDEVINYASFNELQELARVLNFALNPSLTSAGLNDSPVNEDFDKVKVETFMEEDEEIKAEDPFIEVKGEYIELIGEMTECYEEGGNMLDYESESENYLLEDCDSEGGNMLDYKSESENDFLGDCDSSSDILSKKLVMTLAPEDLARLKKIWGKFMTLNVERKTKMWKCTLCENYKTKFIATAFSHIDREHSPNISHKCVLCPFITNRHTLTHLRSHFHNTHKVHTHKVRKSFGKYNTRAVSADLSPIGVDYSKTQRKTAKGFLEEEELGTDAPLFKVEEEITEHIEVMLEGDEDEYRLQPESEINCGQESTPENLDVNMAKKKGAQGAGLHIPLVVSKELCKIIGINEGEQVSRPQAIKKVWAYIKDKSLQDPENRKWFTPDKTMQPIFGTNKKRSFYISKYLKNHLTNPNK